MRDSSGPDSPNPSGTACLQSEAMGREQRVLFTSMPQRDRERTEKTDLADQSGDLKQGLKASL
jgi:hypothetical protein